MSQPLGLLLLELASAVERAYPAGIAGEPLDGPE